MNIQIYMNHANLVKSCVFYKFVSYDKYKTQKLQSFDCAKNYCCLTICLLKRKSATHLNYHCFVFLNLFYPIEFFATQKIISNIPNRLFLIFDTQLLENTLTFIHLIPCPHGLQLSKQYETFYRSLQMLHKYTE